ncbi:MAG: mechanosensitive ion channel domain-containing protein [Candidatus Hodarchaeota archaeon]
MINQTIDDLIRNINDTIESFGIIALIVVSLFIILLIWITGKLLKTIIRQIKWIHPDARNLIFWFISIGQLLLYYLIILGIFTYFGARADFIIAVTAVIATIIGAASISIISNFISGLYILITRPFRVGDLIKIHGKEGIVEEISLNYTKMIQMDRTYVTIPNSNLLDHSLLNYNIRLPEAQKHVESNTTIKLGGHSVLIPDIIPSTLQSLIKYKEIVRYHTQIELRLDMFSPSIPIKTVTERLNQVCDEFTTYFGFRPTYYFGKYDFRQALNLIITAPDGYTIFNSWPFFVEAITQKIFVDLQQEGEK